MKKLKMQSNTAILNKIMQQYNCIHFMKMIFKKGNNSGIKFNISSYYITIYTPPTNCVIRMNATTLNR